MGAVLTLSRGAENQARKATAVSDRLRGVFKPRHLLEAILIVADGAGNIRFRVVGYATTWGLKARLCWAETFPA